MVKRDYYEILGTSRNATEDDIKKHLGLTSTTPRTKTTPVKSDEVYIRIISSALDRAWNQPGSLDKPGLATDVAITFKSGGVIAGRRIVLSSGNSVMDNSVLKAVDSVHRVAGLPPEFISRRPVVTITFQLTKNRESL